MSTIYFVTDLAQTAAPLRRAFHFFERCWTMLQQWQERRALRGAIVQPERQGAAGYRGNARRDRVRGPLSLSSIHEASGLPDFEGR